MALLSVLWLVGGAAGVAVLQRATIAHAPAARRAAVGMAQEAMASPCVIKVVGVGGGGGNAVNRMIQFGQAQTGAVEYWALNTDIQALDASLSPNRLGLGAGTSRGLGAGGSPDTGAASAKESYDQISQMVSGSDMVFVVAGMGGGTGSGGAPIVAEAAKAAGALTVAVVTKPFSFEGQRRMRQANEAISKLKQHVDAMIVVSNDRLLDLVEEGTPLQEAFCVADDILRQVSVSPSRRRMHALSLPYRTSLPASSSTRPLPLTGSRGCVFL
jgi:cell division protein FtsZ